MFFCFVGGEALSNVWTVAVHRVYDSAISDLPRYRGFFLVFSIRHCYLRSDSVNETVGS